MGDYLNLFASVFNDAGYTVTIITDDEPVALAGAIPTKVASTSLFTGTVIAMVVILAIVALAFYFILCRQQQIRIQSLLEGNDVRKGRYNAWNLRSLKEERARLEYIISDKLLDETVRI